MYEYLPRPPNTSDKFSKAFAAGTGELATGISNHLVGKEHVNKENETVKRLTGQDISGISDPKMREKYFELAINAQQKKLDLSEKTAENAKKVRGIEKQYGLEEGSLSEFENDPSLAARVGKPQKEPGGVTAQPVPKHIAAAKRKVLEENPNATASQLEVEFDEAGVPPIHYHGEIESRRRAEEQGARSKESREASIRAETAKIKEEIVNRANSARKGIKNKQNLLNLIKTGNINDPTWATLASEFPLNLGKRLLSNETVQYKAGLVDEFTDLRNIFQGQTRIKEIDILEDKMADIYLTDEQKEAVLKSRIDSLQADVIREEAALEVERQFPNIGILEFNKKVDELSHEKMKNLFDKILDEHKFVIEQAEKRKNIPLDKYNPEDKQIMDQIMIEAGEDPKKAFELAKKKGYKFK